MTRRIMPLIFVSLLALAGCAATTPGPESGTGTGAEQQQQNQEQQTQGQGAQTSEGEAATTVSAADCPPNCVFQRNAIDDPQSVLHDRTIYFDFDSSEVKQKYMDIIKRHAAYLTQYPDVHVRLEGHTDERGSREYNIGLGARRADSVEQLLQAYGVSPKQMDTISYGEEEPAVEGHNEAAWAKNRRVVIDYTGQ